MVTGKQPFPLSWAAWEGKELLGISSVERERQGERYGTGERQDSMCVHGRGREKKEVGKGRGRGKELERGESCHR